MDEALPHPRPSMAPSLLIGMAQGLLLYFLSASADTHGWAAQHSALRTGLWCVALFLPPLAYALRPWAASRIAWGCCALIGVLSFTAGALADPGAPGAPQLARALPFETLFIQGLALFHAVPFLQARLESGRWSPEYAVLFRHTWLNALQLAMAALFAAIVGLLLQLWGELFAMIGLPFVRVLMNQVAGFAWLPAALAFAIGFHLAGSAARLLTALRQQVLSLLKWLAPMAAAILVAFALALLLRAPALLAGRQHAIKAVWLLWLVIVTVYLYNAAYEDGTGAAPYPPLPGRLLRLATPLLVLLALMAAWDIWVRIDGYGITVQRYWAAEVALVTLGYAAGYARVALRGGAWMAGMSRSNELVAIAIIGLLALAQVPALSPGRLAAQSQARLLARAAGKAGPGDFMTLRFDHGFEGYRALQGLAGDAGVDAAIREGARRALAVAGTEERAAFDYTTIAAQQLLLEAFPAGTAIDPALRALVTAEQRPATGIRLSVDFGGDDEPDAGPGGTVRAVAATPAGYPMLFIDLDGDRQVEAVAMLPGGSLVFARDGEGWHKLARLQGELASLPHGARARARLLAQLRAGNYEVVVPHWRLLRIGDRLGSVHEPAPARADRR